MGTGTNYYEKIADTDRYCYFVRSGETFRDEIKHEIACLPHFHKNREFLFCLQGPQEVIISGQKIIVSRAILFTWMILKFILIATVKMPRRICWF